MDEDKSERRRRAYVIVLGNEKGGSGKTTIAMHLAIALLRAGFRVATVDLDGRQGTLTRYVENRRQWMEETGHALRIPTHLSISPSSQDSLKAAAVESQHRLYDGVRQLAPVHDFLVIDCPGSDAPVARYAHRFADTVITPLNDSLLDLDVIVRVERKGYKLQAPGVYSAMVIEQRRHRAKGQKAGLDWIMLPNRLAVLSSRNKKILSSILTQLSRSFGCRVAKGFTERVIYRQLFLSGLTVLDLWEPNMEFKPSDSHRAAYREVMELLEALWLPQITNRLARHVRAAQNSSTSSSPEPSESSETATPSAEANRSRTAPTVTASSTRPTSSSEEP